MPKRPVSPIRFWCTAEVLDEAQAVRGVEFFVRGELRDKVHSTRSATRRFLDTMLIDQLGSLRNAPLRQRQAWVQLAEASLLRLGTGKLPARACVLLWPEDSHHKAHPDTREAIVTMQDAGHEVWLDDAIGSPWFRQPGRSGQWRDPASGDAYPA